MKRENPAFRERFNVVILSSLGGSIKDNLTLKGEEMKRENPAFRERFNKR